MSDTDVQDVSGETLTFLFGDGASPEGYTSQASINTQRSIEIKASLFAGEVPDATNPSGPGFMRRRTKSLDFPFTGAGVADAASTQFLMNKAASGATFDGKVVQNIIGGLGWSIAGTWIIESMKLTGTVHENQTFDITIQPASRMSVTLGN